MERVRRALFLRCQYFDYVIRMIGDDLADGTLAFHKKGSGFKPPFFRSKLLVPFEGSFRDRFVIRYTRHLFVPLSWSLRLVKVRAGEFFSLPASVPERLHHAMMIHQLGKAYLPALGRDRNREPGRSGAYVHRIAHGDTDRP